jgi:gluconolactonase
MRTLTIAICALAGCGDDSAPHDAGLYDSSCRCDGGSPPPDDAGETPDGGTDAGPGEPVDPLEGVGDVELVSTEGPDQNFMFLEGPHWRAADGVLLFTDIPANRIYRLSPPDAIDVFRDDSGGANGLGTDPDGNLLACEHGNRRVSVTRGATVTALVDDYMGMPFDSPNDVAVRSDGTVYFTDPPYGVGGRPSPLLFNGVFRVPPGGEAIAEWMGPDGATPNGIELSPDEDVLYVAETQANVVRAYDVAADGSLSGEREFANAPGPDGMAMDVAGNLYVSTGRGIVVLAPDGSSWGTIEVPMTPANCGFGDDDRRTLYITARTGLYRVRTAIPGR